VKERLKLHNLRIDHVTIGSELKHLVGTTLLGLQRLGFEVEPSPNAMFWVFPAVKPLQWFGSSSNPNPEPFKQVGTVGNSVRKHAPVGSEGR